MVLTINPADAQAIQEDEAQLLSAILQATRGAIAFLNKPPQAPANEPPEAIRIQMGRRLVYGWMADEQFRNELDANKMQAIFDAIQRPVTDGVDPEQYRGKIPAIEIRDGDTVLFREERDGTVTANAIQFQLQQQTTQDNQQTTQDKETQTPQPSSAVPVASEVPGALPNVTPEQEIAQSDLAVPNDEASNVAQIADYLLNPLQEESPIYDAVSIKCYQIAQDENGITIGRDDEPILVTNNGEITANRLTRQDWETFRSLQPQSTAAQNDYQPQITLTQNGYEQNGKHSLVELGVLASDTIQHDLLDAQQNKRNGIWINTVPLNQDSLTLTADVVDINEVQKTQIQDTPLPRDHGSLTVDVAEATHHEHLLPAIAVLERETAKLPESITQQLLQEMVRDLNQQAQGIGQGLRQGLGWLAARAENWQHQRIARATLELFNRGYERTGERAYQVGEYSVSFRGQNLYTLKDNKGELMRFQAFNSPIPGMVRQRIQVLSTGERLGRFQGKELQAMARNKGFTPQGDLDVEAAYTAKTSRVEQIVTHFLQSKVQAHIWDKEGGKFKLEIGEAGFLRITDKQEGRGVVFQRQEGKVSSQLGARDFAHFDRLAAKMQQSEQVLSRPQQTTTRARQNTSGLELE